MRRTIAEARNRKGRGRPLLRGPARFVHSYPPSPLPPAQRGRHTESCRLSACARIIGCGFGRGATITGREDEQGGLPAAAAERIADAQALLAAQRWSAAFYLAGYAVECGLKSCILARVETTGVIFEEGGRKFVQECWTHDPEDLLGLAKLKAARDSDAANNPLLKANWQALVSWSEAARYKQWTQAEATSLFNAINDPMNGVLQWIRQHW